MLRDKFNILMKGAQDQNQAQSIKELKKLDLFDLGVMLTICASGGLDVV